MRKGQYTREQIIGLKQGARRVVMGIFDHRDF